MRKRSDNEIDGTSLTAEVRSGSESNPRDVHELDEDADTIAPNPEYSDLLDVDWIGRGIDAEAPDDDDVADVHLDLMQSGDSGELDEPLNLEFDVGSLLTSVPLEHGIDLDALSSTADVAHSEVGHFYVAQLDAVSSDAVSSDAVSSDAVQSDGEATDGFQTGALQDLLLPEAGSEPHARGDDEIGDDERFPVFEDMPAERPSVSSGDDPGLEGIADEAD